MPRININASIERKNYDYADKYCYETKTLGETWIFPYDISCMSESLTKSLKQATFLFDQSKTLKIFKLIQYFEACSAGEISDGTTIYYEKDGNKFVQTSKSKGDQVEGLFKETNIETDNDNWQYDSHFSFTDSNDCTIGQLILSSEETLEFMPTKDAGYIKFEVATKWSDSTSNIDNNYDIVTIKKLPSIYVIDSLYSKIVK